MGRMKKSEKELYERIGRVLGNLVRKCEKKGLYNVFEHKCEDNEHIIQVTIERFERRYYD